MVDLTDDEVLLKQWKKQLEEDLGRSHEVLLSNEEWSLVEEGVADYEKR